MAEYIIQSETLEEIGNQIRSRTGGTEKLSPTEMASHVQLVYAKGDTNGKENLKTEEARTWRDVSTFVDVSTRTVEVDVSSGYYTNDTLVGVDVQEVYEEGYNDGLADGGGGGGDEPYDPTTVWQINDVPVVISSGIAGTTIDVLFNSAGEEFVKIIHTSAALTYYRSDGTVVSAWGSRKGWSSENYKTITFPEPFEDIVDDTLELWLDTNATLISGSIDRPEEPLDDTSIGILIDQAQSPQVYVHNASQDNQYVYPTEIYGQSVDYDLNFDNFIEIEESSPSSNPFTISALNYTQLYAYLLLYVSDEANYEEFLQWLEVPPYGDNSVDFVSHINEGNPCEWIYEIRGVRFTKYAVEI